MSSPFVVDYQFRQGVAANPDGSARATLQECDHRTISAHPTGWPQLTEALVFGNPRSTMLVPAPDRLPGAQKFCVEVVICVERGDRSVMTLLTGQVLPLRLTLTKEGRGYLLKGEVHLERGWVELSTDGFHIPLNIWTAVGLAYTGRDLLLLKDGAIVARRALSRSELVPLGTGGFVVGGDDTSHFIGEVAGLRVLDTLIEELVHGLKPSQAGQAEIERKHDSLGGSDGLLGKPTGDVQVLPHGCFRPFQHGHIYWSLDTGAYEVHGEILNHYLAYQGPSGILGYPTADVAEGTRAGCSYSRFQQGAIYWHGSTGAHAVHGMIYVRYLTLGGDAGELGLPKTDHQKVMGGQKCEFEEGAIYDSTQSGAHAVYGAILQRYVALGAETGLLRFPISSVEKLLTGDGDDSGGRVSRFQGGAIYWCAEAGAHEVHGEILDLYGKLGGPLGKMGYPITDEKEVIDKGIRYNDFQKGIVVWRSGVGALEITKLRLYIERVSCGKTKDGLLDKTPELVTYLTVKENGEALKDEERRPSSNHAGSSYAVDYERHLTPVHSETTIYWKVKVYDWDLLSKDDYLGRYDRTFDIQNLWGVLDGDPPGIYTDQDATDTGDHLPDDSTLVFDYSIQRVEPLDPTIHFREQLWWRFGNFGTPTLTHAQFAETFRDVEHVEDGWDKTANPSDTGIYEALYKNVAAGGNCYGMSLHALYVREGRSSLVEPLYQYQAAEDKHEVEGADLSLGLRQPINHHHGYQLGASALRWAIRRMSNLEAVRPLKLYERVEAYLADRDYPIITIYDQARQSGHAVLPYKCVPGSGGKPHRILIADPNTPWRLKEGDSASYIEIAQDNTFKLVSNDQVSYQSQTDSLTGLLPTTFLADIPYHQLSSDPRTPFWEIVIGLSMLLGGVLILLGDATTSQISGDGVAYYQTQAGATFIVANAIPGFQHIPLLDYGKPTPELYAQVDHFPDKLVQQITGRGLRTGSYRRYMRTRLSGVELNVPISFGGRDQITVEDASSAIPLYRLQTDQTEKTSRIDYYTILDVHRGDYRRFTADLQLCTGVEALVGMDKDTGSILLKPGGVLKPVNITLETRVDGQRKRSQLAYAPRAAGELITIRPRNWSVPLGEIVIERLTGLDGAVLERILMQAEPVVP